MFVLAFWEQDILLKAQGKLTLLSWLTAPLAHRVLVKGKAFGPHCDSEENKVTQQVHAEALSASLVSRQEDNRF